MAFTVETTERSEAVDVTDHVEAAVASDVERGTCTVFVPHTTAGVAVNEAESGLLDDVTDVLGSLVPAGAGYRHDAIDDNADAHLKAVLTGSSVTIPVRAGSLDLGTWQSVVVLEFDGPRRREVSVTTT